ncbi:MAG: long-chain fatty acid--CoA ligase [Actinobacteria bacterium]|nr:MAG: long-chain fatty acid--CoA ligase [Actinomycetota bacterium]
MSRTIGQLWREAVEAARTNPAYLVEGPDGWREVSWGEAARAVHEIANGLLARGVRKGDAFGILAQTTLEWALFDFALARIGAVGAAIYANSSPKDCGYILEHSDAVGVLVEDEEQRAKVADIGLAHVIAFSELDALRADGREHAAAHPGALAEAEAQVGEDDLFTFIYTSGTTGPPKACMIRHRNYYEMAGCVDHVEEFAIADDTMLLYLPLAHNFGRLMHLLGAHTGYTTAFCPDPLRVAEAIPAVRPTLLPSVPRLYEKVHTGVSAQFEQVRGPRRRLLDWALAVGRRASELRQRGESLPTGLALQHRVADRLVYSKVKKRLGGRLRLGISGGAPLAKEIAEFFHSIDILIVEGWGLTECTTAASVNRPNHFRFGTVGPALPGFEVRTDEDGELLIRSPTVFAGYYKDEEATRGVLDDEGWLRSGDLGAIDEDGFIRITDRKKDILVTAGGKNVAPQNLENALKTVPVISQALVVGDRRPYVAALITVDPSVADGLPQAEVEKRIQKAVDEVNAELSRFEQIKRFVVLPRDFSAEEGEVTPTLKLKRRVCAEHFASEIEQLYST